MTWVKEAATRCQLPAQEAQAPALSAFPGSADGRVPPFKFTFQAAEPFGPQAAMSKLFATDTAMRVATDAVQVLGGYGYVEDFPAERYLREAKILQIVEGTNQVQRVVIGRSLTS